MAAIRLTLITATLTALINAVMGTLLAYVLVRYRFPGRALLSTVADLPIAIPTLVTGLMLVAIYGPERPDRDASSTASGIQVIFAPLGVELALLVVTLPFVLRTVQPVLLELDPAEEEAAATLGASGWTDLPQGRAAGDPPRHRGGRAAVVRAGVRGVRQHRDRLGQHREQDAHGARLHLPAREPVPHRGGRGGRDRSCSRSPS